MLSIPSANAIMMLHYLMLRQRIQNQEKHQDEAFLQKDGTIRKKLHLRYLTEF